MTEDQLNEARREILEAYRCLTLNGHAGHRWPEKASAAIPHVYSAMELLGEETKG